MSTKMTSRRNVPARRKTSTGGWVVGGLAVGGLAAVIVYRFRQLRRRNDELQLAAAIAQGRLAPADALAFDLSARLVGANRTIFGLTTRVEQLQAQVVDVETRGQRSGAAGAGV